MSLFNYEIIHYTGKGLQIFSKKNSLYIKTDDGIRIINLPFGLLDFFGFHRVLRRLLRLDKCNVFLISSSPINLVIMRRSIVYHYSEKRGLKKSLTLRNCRNILHVDLCRLKDGTLAFGEYGANNSRRPVPIYKSVDDGLSWKVCYEFPENTIKHIHVIKFDKYSNTIWCCTGDNDGENRIVIFDESFTIIEELGDGSQYYRTCELFFTKNEVVWLMDSPNITSRVVSFNRKTKSVTIGQELEGPVWYTTKLNDKIYLAATSVEPGYSMKHKMAHLMFSKDLKNWEIIRSFKKDVYPIDFFKYGVIAFPLGEQSIDSVYLFGEALIGFDGEVKKIDLTDVIS